ncbi:hypothetical protein A9G11_10725 [Gilliamella sp. wkB108]|uniref:hypothetical protein n=1 Tax=Gilliamella sp. wkB108 TaxID=3120256 RepID=UPI00080E1F4B|nr:hypothetical protein [Gilliamella apicola]OCG28488.1 hypothetical protein A9G11_10725 [Gilliamella apicola]
MKNFLLSYLLLILVSNFVFALDIDVKNNNYYTLMKDRLNKQVTQTKEGEKLVRELEQLVTYNQQKIVFWGCDFKPIEGNKEDIIKELKKNNFFENYGNELNKYHLTLSNFSKIYTNDRSSSSTLCNSNNYMSIIQLDSNQLMIPYESQLIFYKRPSTQEERNIRNYYNGKCYELDQVDMDSTDICYYKNMTILDVYNVMSFNSDKIFRKKIKVGKNFSVTYDDEDMRVEVEYKWSGKNKLKITQNFDGGVTTYTFIYQGNKTKLITVYSPD